ncbi:MAG: radical SAM protein [Oscillospiraceae bacterium]|nr:radical SAM protein [Oscillospiraceae bacterium]
MNTDVSKLKFHSDVKKFDLDGIPTIGNFRNQVIIGLDQVGVDLILKIESEKIDQDRLTDKQKKLFEALKNNDFFEKESESNKNKNKKLLSTVYLHVTDNCNLHCIGCYSYKKNRNQNKDLSLDQIKYILKILSKNGVSNIIVSGGEPFLRDDLLEILKYSKEILNIKNIGVVSNGTISIEKYDKCLSFIDELSISIDGYDTKTRFIRDPGIMSKVFETINYLKNKINLSLVATLHKKNRCFIEKYIELSKSIKVPVSFSVLTVDNDNPMFKDYILDENDYKQIYEIVEKNKDIKTNDLFVDSCDLTAKNCCSAGKSLISIGTDGTIYPCYMLHREELSLGNILKDNLRQVLNSNKNIFRNLTVDDFKECSECKYKYICGGGCRAGSYYIYKDFTHPKADCLQSKLYYKNIVDDIKYKFKIFNL